VSRQRDPQVGLDGAADADTWQFAVELGEIGIAEHFQLSARTFNSIIHFLPPLGTHDRWRVAWEQVDAEDPGEIDVLGDVATAQVIDVIPALAEVVVLEATREHAQWLEDEPGRRDAHLRLVAELDQASAHQARWRRRGERRYGDLVLYEFPEDAELHYEITEEDGRPALCVFTGNEPSSARRVLIAPDADHAWCYTTAGQAHMHGEWLDVHDAFQRAGGGHADWVRHETGLALGETLARIRTSWDDTGPSPTPDQLSLLARLARHAEELADGLATL
jgi:hypothetical protein